MTRKAIPMKKMAAALLLLSILASCGMPPAGTTATVTVAATATPQATSAPAPQATATETPTPVDEHDLRPAYIETVSQEFMGVMINSQLIVDKSLDPIIRKVTIPDAVHAEFIARTFFKVWWRRGEVAHSGAATEKDFKAFMALWETAQATNDPADWRKVELRDIWANDLTDGNGYQQEPYVIWPMYFGGSAPEGVRGIEELSIALVKGRKVKNITMFKDNLYEEGWGTNLEDATLYVYCTYAELDRTNTAIALIGVTFWWLDHNSGKVMSGYPSRPDRTLYKFLRSGGVNVE